MWGRNKKGKRVKVAKIDTLIGENTEILGDVEFRGGLHVDGTIKGNVIARDDDTSLVSLSESCSVEGEVRVPHVVLNGTVIGDVHAEQHIELKARARVTGNVYYGMIELARGAEVNGNLIHNLEEEQQPLLPHEPPARVVEDEADRLAGEPNLD